MSENILQAPVANASATDGWRVISSAKSLVDLRLREVWKYRDLVGLLVRRDFVATYKQTILGPLWFLIQPLFTSTVFTVIFGSIANLPTNQLPPFVFYLSGVVVWSYFADCLTKTSQTFAANANVFGKVYFPRMTVPIASVITNLITFAIQFTVFAVIAGIFYFKGAPIYPSWRAIVLPVLILQMAMLGIGVGCLTSALTTRYKDLSMVVGFGVQLWMYASGVLIPRSAVPEKLQWIMTINPMVPVIEAFRFALLGVGTVELPQIIVGAVLSAAIFSVGVIVFNRVERTFADTI